MIASVSGIFRRMLVPAPAIDSSSTCPPACVLDVRAHHVHPDAASGDIGDRGSGAEAGPEDQLERFPIAQAKRLVRR